MVNFLNRHIKDRNKQTLHKFAFYFRPHRKILFSAFAFIIILSICEALFPWIFKFVIDTLLKEKAFKAILPKFYIWLLLVILWSISKYVSDYLILLSAHRFDYDLKRDLFNHIQALNLEFFQMHPTGKLMSSVVNDTETIEESLKRDSRDLVTHSLVLFSCLVLMSILDWRLFIVSVILFPAFTNFLRLLNVKFSEIAKSIIEKRARINAYLQEIFSSIRVVKAYTREEEEKLRFDRLSREYLNIKIKDSKMKNIIDSSIGFINQLNLLVVLYLGFNLVTRNKLSFGALVTFIYYMALIRGRFTLVIRAYIPLKQSLAIFNDLIGLKEECPEEDKRHPKTVLRKIEGRIEFRNVWFNYAAQKEPILKNVSFTVEPQDKVMLVGKSGIGKTTLVNLILRFYCPAEGKILIDGYDINEVELATLRRQLAVVSQDDILFNTTVAENIGYGKENASKEEVMQAAKLTLAHEFIISLPKGYETVVGEKGTKLSGGERQRILIARAILKNSAILILDEATSYLNDDYEEFIYQALDGLIKNRTVFIITHRASTIMRVATKVLLFDNEEVRELKPAEYMAYPEQIVG